MFYGLVYSGKLLELARGAGPRPKRHPASQIQSCLKSRNVVIFAILITLADTEIGARHGRPIFFRDEIIHTKHALHRLGEF